MKHTITRSRAIAGLVLGAICLLMPSLLQAQEFKGNIIGRVRDANGTSVVGATVKVTDIARGTTDTLTTYPGGTFEALYVLPGTYQVVVQAPGFKTALLEKIQVVENETRSLVISLEVGRAQETVTVNPGLTAEQKRIAGLSPAAGFRQTRISETWTRFVPDSDEKAFVYGISDIVEYESALWIGTESNGLWRYRGGRFEDMTRNIHAANVRAIFKGNDGALWFAYDPWGGHDSGSAKEREGLARYYRGNWQQFDIPEDLIPGKAISLKNVFATHRGEFFVLTAGLIRFTDGKWTLVSDVPSPSDFLEASDGTIWITEYDGRLWKSDAGGKLQPVTGGNGVTLTSVRTLAETPDGTIWLSDKEVGLTSFKNGKFRPIESKGVLDPDFVTQDGTLFVGNSFGDLALYRDGKWLDRSGIEHWYFSGPVLETKDKVVWYGLGVGCHRVEESTSTPECEKGLAYYAHGVWRRFLEVATNVVTRVSSLHEGADGSIWASIDNDSGRCGGNCSGLITRYSRGDWHTIRTPRGTTLVNAWCNASDGSLWLGTTNGELLRFSPSNATLTLNRTGQASLSLLVNKGYTDLSAWLLKFGFSGSADSVPSTWFQTPLGKTGKIALPFPVNQKRTFLHAFAVDPDGTAVDLSYAGRRGSILISDVR
jgi:carboxypeptidase family protein